MKDNFWIKMFTAHSGLSCKRVCGFLGWIICLFITIYCSIYNIPSPTIADTIIFGAVSLLGVDSITAIWKDKT